MNSFNTSFTGHFFRQVGHVLFGATHWCKLHWGRVWISRHVQHIIIRSLTMHNERCVHLIAVKGNKWNIIQSFVRF